MLQGEDFTVNASTRKITTRERNDIIHYFNKFGKVNKDNISKILSSGVFYDEVYLKSEGHTLLYNFKKQSFSCDKKSSLQYFNISQKLIQGGLSHNKYEQSETLVQINVSFEHSIYGQMCFDFNYFSNPQIKYGIGLSEGLVSGMTGLMIREYKTSSMRLKNISEEREKEGEIGKNAKASELLVLKNNTYP